MLSVVKRFAGYETIGALFREAQADMIELTISERIWQILIELLSEIADFFDTEVDELMGKLFTEDEQLRKLLKLKSLALAG